jgi:hypothetical protein
VRYAGDNQPVLISYTTIFLLTNCHSHAVLIASLVLTKDQGQAMDSFVINGNPHRLEFYQYDEAGGFFRISSAFQGSDSFFSRMLGNVSGR